MNLEYYCLEVVKLVKEAGKFIAKEAEQFDLSRIEVKGSANDMVSYVDKETEKMLVAGLQRILPEAGFITEEATINKNSDEWNWVVDPLDGTTNFLHAVPAYAISVALMYKNEVKVGVVLEVTRDECFYAWQGGGAYMNAKKIQVSPIPEITRSLIATGFPYDLEDKGSRYLAMMEEILRNSHGLRRFGAAAVDMCWVALGRFEAYFEYNIKLWDIAAGICIVQEAGGKVTDFKGQVGHHHIPQVVAAGPVHAQLLPIIERHWFAS